jgi:hypothetical protein
MIFFSLKINGGVRLQGAISNSLMLSIEYVSDKKILITYNSR